MQQGRVYPPKPPRAAGRAAYAAPQLPHPSLQRPQECRSHRRHRANIALPPPCGKRAMDRSPGAPRRGPHGSWGAGGGAGAPFSLCPGSTCRRSPSSSSPARGAPRNVVAALPQTGARTPRAARRCRGTRLRLHGRAEPEPGPGRGGRGRWRRPQRSPGARLVPAPHSPGGR